MNVDETLKERGTTHGDFGVNAACAQMLKGVCHDHCITALSSVQLEALENICQKMARILTGNPNHADNWHDIAGYAKLAEQELYRDNT
jgi:UDP-N-acetylmuramoylalanine-D-glutamate ligase